MYFNRIRWGITDPGHITIPLLNKHPNVFMCYISLKHRIVPKKWVREDAGEIRRI